MRVMIDGTAQHQLHQLVVVRHPCLLRLTVVRRSHRRSTGTATCEKKRQHDATRRSQQHPTYSCSLLLLLFALTGGRVLACVCE